MTITATAPGQYNTFIPNVAASKGLVVDFSRNPKDFALPRYVQYVSVQKNAGQYIRMTVEQAGRILDSNGGDFFWPDGADAPLGYGNRELFEFQPYRTKRFAFPVMLGELAVEQAEWDVLAQHARIQAQQCMTWRTQQVVTDITTSANWDGNTVAATSITGVTAEHDLSTTARKDIKRTLDYAADQIRLKTLGAVKPDQLHVVVGPDWARRVAVSQEIVDHVKQSPAAREELEKGLGPNVRYGLPSTLYGYNIEVEDAVKTTSRKGAASVAKSYVMSGSNLVMLSRVGELEGVEGSPSFSTVTLFLKEEMTVESKHDRDNRRHQARVVDDYDSVITAPASGYLVTGCLSS